MTQYILTDIEGTTTAVKFVYEILFPYFSVNFEEYAFKNIASETLQKQLEAVKETLLAEENTQIDNKQAIAQLLAWTQEDRKHPALKHLQGLVWQEGYLNGSLKGHIYEDVAPRLKQWHQAKIGLGIYSSGSVQAQKLLFANTAQGDLTPLFEHYFDTAVGAKREAKSYQNIVEVVGIKPENILFLSDIEAELDAAKEVGLQTIQLLRGEAKPSTRHKTSPDFTQIKV